MPCRLSLSRLLIAAVAVWSSGCGSDGKQGASDADVLADGDGATFPETVADSDLPELDVAEVEVGAGEFGATCSANFDCNSGYCVEGPAGYICTRACDSTCPEGFDCKSIPGQADISFVCVPQLRRLCTPCSDDLQCAGGACLYNDGVGGCAASCEVGAASNSDNGCTDGFRCAADPASRVSGTYCQPITGSCSCSSVENAGERTCSVTTPAGQCFGVERCDVNVGWGACSATAPNDELCNGLDDDCNGRVDDGLDDGAACENTVGGVGSCAGTSVCTGTPGWLCDGPVPSPEVCNGNDDDCDGGSDEDFKDASGNWTLATACGRCGNDCTDRFANGVGRCGGTVGTPACVVDHCDPGFVLLGNQCVAPVDTTCQRCGGDDDCIGGACLAYAGAETAGSADVCFMPCAAARSCPDGLACTTFGSGNSARDVCAPTSGSCACTAALTGNQRTCSVSNGNGRCLGIETCDGDAWTTCTAATPAVEICNGSDDNCDGQLDEDARWENRGAVCVSGSGVCQVSGTFVCDSGNRSGPTICSAAPGASRAETCNGLDDDCDDATDEQLDAPLCPLQLGVCAGARAVCAGVSGFLACNSGSYGDHHEIEELSCDGRDNDCDGDTDEVDRDSDGHIASACGGDDCNDASKAAHPGLFEVCGDGLDNDCDGGADNKDGDHDGHVDVACAGDDCDDNKAFVYLGAPEVCGNAIDEDCHGVLDDKDQDGDGERDVACAGTDCDDADPQVASGGREIWDTKDNDCDGLVDEGVVPVGTVIVSEVMRNPGATVDPLGEYFELTNVGASPVNLASWAISDGPGPGANSFTVNRTVLVPPGGTAVLCHDGALVANGGYCSFVYGAAMELADEDAIIVSLAGVEIDRVTFGAAFPATEGRALNLDPAQYTRVGNDTAGNWCATIDSAGNRLASGDYGTPGRVNPSCSGSPGVIGVVPGDGIEHGGDVLSVSGSGFIAASAVTLGGVPCKSFTVVNDNLLTCVTPAHQPGLVAVAVTKAGAVGTLMDGFRFTGDVVTAITWCDLQYPASITAQAGQVSGLIYGQVRAQGVTEPAGAPTGISGQVGYGPLGSDPRVDPGWRWLDATWNLQFFDNDEFLRSLLIPTAGTYSYTFRFSDDGGTNFMYGDYDPGTANGFSPGNLGTVTVE